MTDQPNPRNCTCDGWCDGLCKEGEMAKDEEMEVLELAEKHGATLSGTPDGVEPLGVHFTPSAWRAFAQDIRDQEAAKVAMLEKHISDLQTIIDEENKDHIEQQRKLEEQIARLVDVLSELHDLVQDYLDGQYDIDSFTLQPARLLLQETQPTADAFVAGIKAEAKLEGKVEALEELMRRMSVNDETAKWNIDDLLRDLHNGKE